MSDDGPTIFPTLTYRDAPAALAWLEAAFGFVPAMVAKKKGVIVNFSSGWGRSVAPEVASYCMSKWAIEGLTKALAEELPKGMAAVPLNPGVIDTAMLRSCWADGAASCPKADVWVKAAAPFILQLGAKDNGRSVSVGGED